MRSGSFVLVLVPLAACGGSSPPASHPTSALPATLTADAFLGAELATFTLDLDGDTRPDTITLVHDAACTDTGTERDEDGDLPCDQGFFLALAAGPTSVAGAGTTLDADPAAPEEAEPLALEADLGYLQFLSLTTHRADGGLNAAQLLASPCAGDALVLSGGDAAFLLCWRGTSARAYHLGY
jgi:hypothetical protein